VCTAPLRQTRLRGRAAGCVCAPGPLAARTPSKTLTRLATLPAQAARGRPARTWEQRWTSVRCPYSRHHGRRAGACRADPAFRWAHRFGGTSTYRWAHPFLVPRVCVCVCRVRRAHARRQMASAWAPLILETARQQHRRPGSRMATRARARTRTSAGGLHSTYRPADPQLSASFRGLPGGYGAGAMSGMGVERSDELVELQVGLQEACSLSPVSLTARSTHCAGDLSPGAQLSDATAGGGEQNQLRTSRAEEMRIRQALHVHESVINKNREELTRYRAYLETRDEEMRKLMKMEDERLQVQCRIELGRSSGANLTVRVQEQMPAGHDCEARGQMVLDEYRHRYDRERARLQDALVKAANCAQVVSDGLAECLAIERQLFGYRFQPLPQRDAHRACCIC